MIPAWFSKIRTEAVTPLDPAKTGQAVSALVAREDIVAASRVLWDQGYHLEDLSACDVTEGFVVKYHFAHWVEPGRITLRVGVPHDDAAIPTISAVYPGANWHERECHDFHGVVFTGHPNLSALLLPDDDTPPPLVKTDAARKSRTDVMPLEYLVDSDVPPEAGEAGKPTSTTATEAAAG